MPNVPRGAPAARTAHTRIARRSRVPLDTGWTVRQISAPFGSPVVPEFGASVPGCVHTDLLALALIDDPVRDCNEHEVAWVAECDWRYTRTLLADDELLRHDHLELAFDGLDTLATVRLDGAVIGRTANMHRRYRFDLTDRLTPGEHRLEVVFHSATRYAERMVATEGAWPSASFGRPFNHVRKMACSWGWDWGPALTTAGIWRPVALEGWSAARLGDVRPHPSIVGTPAGDGRTGQAALDIDIDIDVDAVRRTGSDAPPLYLRVTLTAADGRVVGESSGPVHGGPSVRVCVDPGTVECWWPHTHGAQPLYTLRVEIADGTDQGATVLDSRTQRIGFRTVALDTRDDASGSAFTFEINGRPIFAKGVNWIPDDTFPSRITADRYRERLEQARSAGADMVRVWGGGIYEDDRFYDACDELGLLVWQDFAFACAAYPEPLLADEVAAEAHDNVSRLMHHPSLAIWNGNNENLWGFADWGWEAELAGRPWGAGFYFELLPQVCAELDPHRPYWPGSPWSGDESRHPNADGHGCTHLWDVWNDVDLVRYRTHVPRFVAEFGWQAPPSMPTMASAVSPGERRRDSAAMRNHQKAVDGDLKLDRGIVARFGEPADLETFWYAAHVVQARAVRTGIEHFRSLRPVCMGTIWWQLNDCWPAASWALVDSAGRRKPAWDALRAAYRPRLLTLQGCDPGVAMFAVNDGHDEWELDGFVRRLTLGGGTIAERRIAVRIAPGTVWSMALDIDVAAAGDPRGEVLVAGDAGARDAAGYAWWWYAPDRELDLHPPALDVGAEETTDGVALEMTSHAVVPDLTIYPERVRPGATADRQQMTLHPGTTERIVVTGVGLADVPALLARPALWSVHDAAVRDRRP